MARIILDANFILLPLERKVDIYSQLRGMFEGKMEFVAPRQVFSELSAMAGERGKRARLAKAALELAQKNLVGQISSTARKADDAIVEAAGRQDVVCTNDAALGRKLAAKGVRTLSATANGMLAAR